MARTAFEEPPTCTGAERAMVLGSITPGFEQLMLPLPAEKSPARLRVEAPLVKGDRLCSDLGRTRKSEQAEVLTSLEQDRQAREPAQEAPAPAHLLGRDGQSQVRVPPEQRIEGDVPFDARQRRPEADVDAFAEGNVPVSVGPRDVEDVRVGEPHRVPVGRSKAYGRLLPCWDQSPAHLDILPGDAPTDKVYRSPVAQRLLDYPPGKARICPQLRQLVGVGKQGDHPVSDQVHRGNVSCEEHEKDRREYLVLIERVAVLLGVDEAADHVLCRSPPLALEEVREVVDELPQPRPNLLVDPTPVDAEKVLGPPPYRLTVLARDAEHVADNRHREGVGEGLDQVHPPVGRRLTALGGVALDLV